MTPELPTTRQLLYFVALAEAGQYRRAAQRLGLSQPSLSQQIAGLEGLLGLKLVERGRRGIVLTPGGREVLDKARYVLDGLEGLVDLSASLRDGVSGTLRVGSTSSIGPYVLPRLLSQLHRDHPDLKLMARDGPPRDLLEDLQAGVHDLILTHLPLRSDDLIETPLYREPLLLAVARDHVLAGRESVKLNELAGESVLSLSPSYALYAQVARICRDAGARLRDDYEGTSLDALRQMVAMNMGVAFLPSLYVLSEIPDEEGDVAVVPVQGGLYRSVGLAWRQETGKSRMLLRVAGVATEIVRQKISL